MTEFLLRPLARQGVRNDVCKPAHAIEQFVGPRALLPGAAEAQYAVDLAGDHHGNRGQRLLAELLERGAIDAGLRRQVVEPRKHQGDAGQHRGAAALAPKSSWETLRCLRVRRHS
ncbi:hypothetical protein QTI66_34175 [Variovorax sp. J22R133]|nr:hypothetical protein [Variovorax sp. J22R133]MDM0117174.1 hypothetical protein [Variovorax sp. J22R133]